MDSTRRTRLLIGAGALLTLVAVVVVVRLLTDRDAPAAAPPPAASASATESASPAPPDLEQFKVTLRAVKDQPMDGGGIFGRKPDLEQRLVRQTARDATTFLERYLNAMFVQANTRSKAAALDGLLSTDARRALDARDRRALGVGSQKVIGGSRPQATARVAVLHDGPRVTNATVAFQARMRVVTDAGRETQLNQRGVFVLVPFGQGWRIDMADVSYTPPEKGRPPAPAPSESGSGATTPTEEGTS